MAVTQTLSEGLKREFEVVITSKEINKLVEVKLNDLAKEANLPGFRPGKVPVSVVKNRFGKQILGEVVRESVDNATKDTIENNKLEDLKAKLSLELMPEFEIPDLSKLDIIKPVVQVGEKEVDEAIGKIASENVGTKTVTAKRPAKLGDTVVIDFLGKIGDVPFEGGEAKGHNLKLGSNSFIPGFEDGLVGCSKGKKVNIKVTFPKDYQVSNLEGKEADFETTINDIKKN
jgi:trigger factor